MVLWEGNLNQLMCPINEYHSISSYRYVLRQTWTSKANQSKGSRKKGTSWPKGFEASRGHPLRLIEYIYMIVTLHQIFCHFNYTNLTIFEIFINPKKCPPLTFINLKVFRGVPSSNFHQPKGFKEWCSPHIRGGKFWIDILVKLKKKGEKIE